MKWRILIACSVCLLTGCWPHKPVTPVSNVPPPGLAEKPFDVVWNTTDPNGYPQAPTWSMQAKNPSNLPPPTFPPECAKQPYVGACTSQIPSSQVPPNTPSGTIDEPVFPNLMICSLEAGAAIHGHANWTVAQYNGAASWAGIAFDGDYNLALVPANLQGITQVNERLSSGQRYIEAEFDSAETGDRFVTDWWHGFKEAVVAHDDSGVQKLITPASGNLPQAVVIGLFGLDCEHQCHSELHPVYGLAIETEDEGENNTWAIFVRNWGDEGFCSRFDHQLGLKNGEITIFLPRKSAGTPTVLSTTQFNASDGTVTLFPTIQHVAGQGTAITFKLPPPQNQSLTELVLHMKWTGDTYSGPPVAIHQPQRMIVQKAAPAGPSQEKGPQDAEEYLDSLYQIKVPLIPKPSKPEAAQPLVHAPSLPKRAVEVKQVPLARVGVRQNQQKASVVVDQKKAQRDCEKIRQICNSYNNSPPTDVVKEFPQLCEKIKTDNTCPASAQ